MHPSSSPRYTGFTLIELLVVITIIAILAALLFPGIRGAQAKAKQVKCISQLKQWGTAISLYASDNDQKIEWSGVFSSDNTNVCPYQKYFGGFSTVYTMRWCPAVAFNNVGNAPVCYSFIRPNYTAGGQAISNSTPYRLTQISRAADLMLMLDAIDVKGTEYIGGNGDSFTTAVQPICVNSVSSQIRHSGGVNALFADFHVQYIQWSDLDATTPQGLANRNLWTSLQ